MDSHLHICDNCDTIDDACEGSLRDCPYTKHVICADCVAEEWLSNPSKGRKPHFSLVSATDW